MATRLSDMEVFPELFSKLHEWLSAQKFFGKDRVEVVEMNFEAVNIRLYTATYCYSIYVNKGRGEWGDSMGCIVSCRTRRAGEDWHRGSDLPDGPYSKETFDRIIMSIIGFECIKVEPDVKQVVCCPKETVDNQCPEA